MKIFVTGGSGYIGQFLLAELIEKGYEVDALGKTEKCVNIVSSLGAKPIKGDLRNIDSFKSEMQGSDAIIHLAAMVEMWDKYDEFYQINVKATEHLLKAANEIGIERFVHISSATVIADGRPLVQVDENYQPTNKPPDNYSKTKALAEEVINKDQGKIKKIILRPPLVWGPRMKFIEEFRPFIEKRGFPIIGDIDHTLATCHIKNLNSAIIKSLKSDKEGTYFITDGESRPLKLFMKDLTKGYGLDIGNKQLNRSFILCLAIITEFIWSTFNLKGIPPITKSTVYFMGTEFSINDSKARKELGYKNVITMNEGLKQLMESLMSESKTYHH